MTELQALRVAYAALGHVLDDLNSMENSGYSETEESEFEEAFHKIRRMIRTREARNVTR